MEILRENGAKINEMDNYNGTVLDYVILMKHKKISRCLRGHGAKTGAEIKENKN